ncbi:MAG TPA: iron-containing redox enzyme family protein [Actinomycetes bacterium]|nr:iron-containing redox enzyme family protein [Actinomycetes bacterium]
MPYGAVLSDKDLAPSALPARRGPLTDALFDLLERDPDRARVVLPTPSEGDDDPLFGDDSALALYCLYELHYRGFDGVDAEWEWAPGLIRWRNTLEEAVLKRIRDEVGPLPRHPEIPDTLHELVANADGPSLSSHLLKKGTPDQFREMAIHRSIYQLKEADPHTWTLPRLTGRAKAAAVEIQADEYGQGVARDMHQNLFGITLEELGLDPKYHAYLPVVPGWTLASTNAVSLFGLHRRWLGAAVGHLALFEMTSVEPMGANAAALRRLGFGPDARHFFSVHVVADAHHQTIAADHLAKGLVEQNPDVARDVLFGAATVMALEGEAARRMLEAWGQGRSSLLPEPSPQDQLALSG